MNRALRWALAAAGASLLGCGGGPQAAGVTGSGASSTDGHTPALVDLDQPLTPAPSCPDPAPPVPSSAASPSFLVQGGHSKRIRQILLSADGRVLTTAGLDGTVRVWDTTTGLLLRRLLTEGPTMAVSLSEAGDKLAYYAADGTAGGAINIAVVDLAAGGEPRPITTFGEFQLAPDGKTIAVGLKTITLYDTATGAKLRELDLGPLKGIVHAVAFDRAGKRLAAALDGELVVIDVPAWKILQRSPQPGYKTVADTVFAPNLSFAGDALLLQTATGAVHLVGLAPGSPVHTLPGPFVASLSAGGRAWTLDHARPRTPGGPSVTSLQAWDPLTGAQVFQRDESSYFTKLSISADGAVLALHKENPNKQFDPEGRSITLRDAATMRPLRLIDVNASGVTAVAASPDGRHLITGSTLGALARWHIGSGELEQFMGSEEASEVLSVAYDAPGAQVASLATSYWVRVRDAANGKLVRQWKPHGDKFVAFAGFVPRTSDLVTVSRDGDIARATLAGPLPPPSRPGRFTDVNPPVTQPIASLKRPVDRAAIAPDGAWIALDDNSGQLSLVDPRTGVVRWTARVPSSYAPGRARFLGFSADGARLFLSAYELRPNKNNIPIFTAVLHSIDAATGAVQQTITPETAGPLAALGGTLALGGVRPLLLDEKTLATRVTLRATGAPIPDREVSAIAAHPLRSAFLLGGDGGTTSILAADTGKARVHLLSTPIGEYVTATPEGAFLASLDGARSIAWAFSGPLESYSFEQFAARFERPDVVRRRLAGEDTSPPARVSRPPTVRLEGAPLGRVDARSIPLAATVASPQRVDRVRVFVNGRAVAERAVCAPRARVDLDVPLAVGRNRVSVIAYDAAGFASSPRSFDVVSSAPGAARPDLWILTVGVSRYKNLAPEHQLDFADDDARSVAAAFADQATRQGWFAQLHPTTLLDEQVTVESVERAVASLAAMKPDDLAVLFFAGHGVRLEDGRMVFLTSTAALTAESARKSGVGWDRINAALGRVRGRVLMLLDACHSGHVSTEVIAPNEALARDLAAGGRAGALVFAAARGSQLSYEVPPGSFTGSASRGTSRASSTRGLELAWDDAPALSSAPTAGLEGGHGLFTSAVLEALAGGAVDRDRSGAVELAEFVDYVTERVRVASNGRQTPWVARREMFGDFMVAPAKR